MTTEQTILPAFDASAAPVSRKTGERYQYTYWAVNPFDAPDTFDCTPHVRLSVSYDKGRGYTAVLDETRANFADGIHRELIGIGARMARVTIATLPAARFNRAKFDAFAAAALDTVVTTYGASA